MSKVKNNLLFVNFSPYGYHKTNKKILIRLLFIAISIICIEVSTLYYINGKKIIALQTPSISTLQSENMSLISLSQSLTTEYDKANENVKKSYTPELNAEVTSIIAKLPPVTMTQQLNTIDTIMQKYPGFSLENMDISSGDVVYILDYDTMDNFNAFMGNLEQYYTEALPLSIKQGQAKIQLRGYNAVSQ